MAIPEYRAWIVPLLVKLKDGREYSVDELNETLADELGLTAEDRLAKTACNRQLKYRNRLVMARTQLMRSSRIQPGKRNKTVAITGQGLEYLLELQGQGVISDPPTIT